MHRNSLSTVLSFMLVLTLLACAAQPVFAEAPPPPGDEGAAPAAASSPVIPDEKEAEPEKEALTVEVDTPAEVAAPALDLSQWAPPPVLDTGGTAPATTAAFVSDEQMLDSGGVLRAQGETLAALFVAGAIACPAGKIPVIYGGLSDTGCTPYYSLPGNPIQQAHDHAKTITGWWIWVSPSYPNAGVDTILTKSVTVKGDTLGTSVTGGMALDWSSISLRDLVVQDGQITSAGRSGTLRLQGVNVTGAFGGVYAIDIIGHKGSISLANVTATNSTGGGAQLDVRGGTGTVTVLNSAFNNNLGEGGLTIWALNAVKVENVSASGNGKSIGAGNGLHINYRTRLTLKNIYANDNAHRAIFALDTHPTLGGPVTLDNITANDNNQYGGILLANPGPVSGSNLTIQDTFWDDGFQVVGGRGAVALSGVTAVGNEFWGINIETSGSVSVSSSRVADNDMGGLTITNKGTVAVKNSTFYLNTDYFGGPGDGVNIDNSAAATPLGVTLTNLNAAQNDGYGIRVTSKGTLTLSGIASRANGRAGAWLVTSGGGVTVSSSYGDNAFVDNGTDAFCMGAVPDQTCTGLYIDAKGAVSVSGASANGNRWDGMGILNASSTRVSASTAYNNFQSGLYVSGKGSITLDRVTSMNNANGSGVYLTNTSLTVGNPSILLSHVLADRNGSGMFITSRGPVTLNHASASYNSSMGIQIDNNWGGAGLGAVTVTNSLGSDLISHNTNDNLTIYSRGTVSLRGVNASGSLTGPGAWVDNTYGTGGVSISSSDFNGNGDGFGDFGLQVKSKGSITLNTVTASNNKGMGADLQNQFATLTGKTVSVSKGLFNNNGYTGVFIGSKSSVTLNNVIVSGNNAWGAIIDNYQLGAGTGNVTISSSLGRNLFNNNFSTGAYIETGGNVSVSNAEANGAGNFSSGFYIKSHGTAKTATFTCVSATNNTYYGIDIALLGGSTMSLTLKGVWLGGNTPGNLLYTGTPKIYLMTCP